MENFRRFFQNFFGIFYNFFGIFCNFFGKFLQFFGKFLQFFWKISTIFLRFSENFSENSRSQSVTVQPGSRHYCKFTSRFTSKFTPILIKILQSTKFEGSHFHNLFQLLIHFHNLPKPFPLFALLSLRRRVFPTIAPPCQRHQWPSLPSRWRRYVGNTRDYK